MKNNAETIASLLDRPVVMLGLMGAGKTKIGGLLANALNLPFVDADHEIELAAGCSISEIFERHGEPAFRDLERKVLARLLSDELKVIAPGGGAIMNEQTAQVVWDKAISVWLKADLDVLVERTGRNDKRPLLKGGDRGEILQGLMDKRYPVYSRATLTVPTNSADTEVTLATLMDTMARYLESRA